MTDLRDRHRFLVSYDIKDKVRLRRVHMVVKGFGWPMQYSVFICDLDSIELLKLKTKLVEVIDNGADKVAFIDLGLPGERGRACFSFMGVATKLPNSGPVII